MIAGLQIVADRLPRGAAEIGEGADMRGDPIRQLLAPHRLGVGEARGAEHGDKDLHRDDLAGDWRRPPRRCGRRNRRTASRRRHGPGASSASAGRPSPGKGRRTRNSRTRRARRRGTPPTAAPASRRDGAARDAPRPNRASGADRPGCRRAAGTAALRAARRRDPRAAARRARRRVPGSNSSTPCPGSARGCGQSPAAAAGSPSTVAKRHGSGASTVSRPASRPPLRQRGRGYLRLRTVSAAERYTIAPG